MKLEKDNINLHNNPGFQKINDSDNSFEKKTNNIESIIINNPKIEKDKSTEFSPVEIKSSESNISNLNSIIEKTKKILLNIISTIKKTKKIRFFF